MDTAGLLNQRVKILLRRFHPQTPREIVRGIITDVDETGLRVSGRRFQEHTELESGAPLERRSLSLRVAPATFLYFSRCYNLRSIVPVSRL